MSNDESLLEVCLAASLGDLDGDDSDKSSSEGESARESPLDRGPALERPNTENTEGIPCMFAVSGRAVRSGLGFKIRGGGSATTGRGCTAFANASGVCGSEIVTDLLALVVAASELVEDLLLVRLLRVGLSGTTEIAYILSERTVETMIRMMHAIITDGVDFICISSKDCLWA
jgi:hypothetical protein